VKQNCWEFNKCGYDTGRGNAAGMGSCSATTENRLNGVHGGINAGRSCWVVSGTRCNGCMQGSYSQKITECRSCEFFLYVNREEGENALKTITMLDMLG
jgi:hypothetical protein